MSVLLPSYINMLPPQAWGENWKWQVCEKSDSDLFIYLTFFDWSNWCFNNLVRLLLTHIGFLAVTIIVVPVVAKLMICVHTETASSAIWFSNTPVTDRHKTSVNAIPSISSSSNLATPCYPWVVVPTCVGCRSNNLHVPLKLHQLTMCSKRFRKLQLLLATILICSHPQPKNILILAWFWGWLLSSLLTKEDNLTNANNWRIHC